MTDSLISVVMSTYNEEEGWIRKSVESILQQTYENLEFIIVLDNPENHVLNGILQEYAQRDNRIRLIPNEQNIGLVASLNRGLTYAQGEYVARMDADDISYPDRLEKQLATMRETNADFVMSAIDLLQEDGTLIPGIADETFGANAVAEVMKYGNIAHHPTWFLKKKLYEILEGYRDVQYCEDLDFVFRAIQQGAAVVKSCDHVVQYRLRESGVSKKYAMEQTLKAQYLRDQYAMGQDLSQLSVDELNQRFGGYQDQSREQFHQAMQRLDRFSQDMAMGKWMACLGSFLKGSVTNPYFRKLFWEYVRSWRVRKRLAERR